MVSEYLVLGGAGALGKFIVSILLSRKEKSESDERTRRRQQLKNNPGVEVFYGISTDKDSMKEFLTLKIRGILL